MPQEPRQPQLETDAKFSSFRVDLRTHTVIEREDGNLSLVISKEVQNCLGEGLVAKLSAQHVQRQEQLIVKCFVYTKEREIADIVVDAVKETLRRLLSKPEEIVHTEKKDSSIYIQGFLQ